MEIINIILDALQVGIPYGILALGVFISYRVLDFADLTTEGTFVFGGAVSIVLILHGVNPWIAMVIAMIMGFLAGCVTGLLHTYLKIPGLLAGIITMTALFSINMCVMGWSADYTFFSLFHNQAAVYIDPDENNTIYSILEGLFERKYCVIIISFVVAAVIALIVYLFFGTEFGMSMRATGMNQKMARAQGINTVLCIVIGLGLSNALIALAAVLESNRMLNTSTQNGTGMIVVGLASIIIGEAVVGKKTFKSWLISVIVGGVLYYLVVAIAVALGLPNHLLKLLYAVIIVLILVVPLVSGKIKKAYNQPKNVLRREAKVKAKYASLTAEQIEELEAKKAIKQEKIAKKEEKYLSIQEEKRLKYRKHLVKVRAKRIYHSAQRALKLENKLANNQNFKLKYDNKQKQLENERIEKQNYINEHGILSVNNLVKKFNPTGNPEDLKIALAGIDLNIKEGEFVTIIGGNGSGKSTFFNTVSGTYIPDDGNIIVSSNDITKMPEYKRAYFIGRVAQDPYQGTAPNMSILENMSLAMRRNKRKTLRWGFKKSDTEMFRERIERLNLGLENRMNAKIGTLSGGQRQAVTLLMATLQRPEVLFLDEHTAALDPKTAKTVLELTNQIVREENLTAVMVTHNMKDAIKYGDRLLMFNNGKIIYDVSGEEKANLTVEDLLKKFENQVEFSDKDILSN